MTAAGPTFTCSGCEYVVPKTERYPFRCPKQKTGDNIDHVLREELPAKDPTLVALFDSTEPNPFLKYRTLFHSYRAARSWGLSDADYIGIVQRLDEAVAKIDGRGFVETPFASISKLGDALGFKELWVKDETGNVSGSHKARHTMGIMIWMEMVRKAFPNGSNEPSLAISSCGNAALAAAVVAKAAGRTLDVFVPPDAHPNVVHRLQELGARLVTCRREGNQPGDPCYLRFKEGIAKGSLPFTVQGNENGLTISGGKTLAYEMVSRWRSGRPVDRLFVHVGGGALASAIIQGMEDAKAIGLIDRLPRIHTVQTEGAYPLARAYQKVAERVAFRNLCAEKEVEKRSMFLSTDKSRQIVNEELWFAANHRSTFMWPWESEPKSIAHGILDDETYDWHAVVGGMLRSGGYPVVVSEENLKEAHRLCHEHTKIRADHTGTAGLAGALKLRQDGVILPNETVAVLFTGVER
ncbi:MAG: pyridoxal-phosphate dependent enzyme [Pseudomonadota bacterium]